MKEFVEKLIARLEENGQKMSEAKAIRPYAKHCPSDHRYYKAISVRKAIEIINELAEEHQQTVDDTDYTNIELYSFWQKWQWRDVNEVLPMDNKYILLSFCNFSLPAIGRYEAGVGAFYLGDELETCISHDLFVDAWMPLPDPYRPE